MVWPLLEVRDHSEGMGTEMGMWVVLRLVLGELRVVEEEDGGQTRGRLDVLVSSFGTVLWQVEHWQVVIVTH
jgi:hypothetical protein